MFKSLVTLPAMIVSAGAALADGPENYPAGGYYGHPMMWGDGYGLFGVVSMLLFWGVVIVLAVVAVRWLIDQRSVGKSSSALDILKERLAKGEIEPEEYETRRKALEN